MTDTPKKPRRRLTFADHLAEIDQRIARNREQATKLATERAALVQAERDRVASAQAILADATGAA